MVVVVVKICQHQLWKMQESSGRRKANPFLPHSASSIPAWLFPSALHLCCTNASSQLDCNCFSCHLGRTRGFLDHGNAVGCVGMQENLKENLKEDRLPADVICCFAHLQVLLCVEDISDSYDATISVYSFLNMTNRGM